MRSLSFLLSRRWILFFVAVVVLTWLAVQLGEWQFNRLDDRKDRNAIVERNETADPVPVEEALQVGEPVGADEQWLRVTATGEYDAENTVIVRYRTREGQAGVDVVVPLVTEDGTALIVDRGWLATENRGGTPDELPAPPDGTVTVTGFARQDATGDSAKVSDKSTRAISSVEISKALDLTTYGGFVDLESEDPAPDEAPAKPELPDLGEGPHFFYGLQWWFFGLLAVIGFLWMARDEWRTQRRPRESSRTED